MHDLPRKLSLVDSIAIVIGTVIGGGIFLVPNLVARNLGSGALIVAVWSFAGMVSFFGTLACAELGAAFPATGGQYVYLRDAYGPMVGFLCGWSMFTVARSAQVAWMAVIFALYVSYFVPLGPVASKLLGVGVILVFSWINYRGVRAGAGVQKSFTAAKIVGVLIIVVGAFVSRGGAPAAAAPAVSATFSLSSFGVALIACLLAYDGWVQLTFVAGEIRDPQKNVLRALAIGSVACIAIYLLANFAYLRMLSIPEIAASDHVGATAAERILGAWGGKFVSAIILVSILGTLNGCFLTTPRVYFAQAADGLFFRRFTDIHPRFQTPSFAIVAQGVWAVVLVITGSYETLVDYALFAMWISYGLMVAAVMILRKTRPDVQRPYRMWGYPVTPLLFLGITGWFLVNMLMTRPGPSLVSLALIATGVPAYFIWKERPRAAHAVPTRS
ncbi:MAG: amino acid transporter [Proteobacteria bacterium]|nr:MAG: amino acid transporter [Pseudomonadota bacterium]